ncbi:hypothetical protein [Vibrio caribbeanicus]|uniref:hypothetical protein n=1 Tax=Vibrio caribbeanicus TaxID=701175 RepID=UPI0030DB1702
MNEQLQKAVTNLFIENVSLKEMQVLTDDKFDPDSIPDDIYDNAQSYKYVTKFESFDYDSSEGENQLEFYRFTYSIGLRFIPGEQRVLHEQGEIETDDLEPSVEFKATYLADYAVKEPLEQEAVDLFAEHHVGFHIWPYWREFVQSSCARLGLPPLVVQPYVIKKQ